jgi:hypothetical protein
VLTLLPLFFAPADFGLRCLGVAISSFLLFFFDFFKNLVEVPPDKKETDCKCGDYSQKGNGMKARASSHPERHVSRAKRKSHSTVDELKSEEKKK